VPPTFLRRVVSWLALAGQLALLADGAIAHVTCAVHGDLVHATASGPARAETSAHAALAASVASDEGAHDRCLIDEDGDVAFRPAPTSLPAPARLELSFVVLGGRGPARRLRAPLYRLAPKNSPPA
jgi:hypothetical protein